MPSSNRCPDPNKDGTSLKHPRIFGKFVPVATEENDPLKERLSKGRQSSAVLSIRFCKTFRRDSISEKAASEPLRDQEPVSDSLCDKGELREALSTKGTPDASTEYQ